jgi:GNAT superfamily N-acetyltransferase
MREYLTKAIGDLEPGKPTDREGVTDYTHLLPESLRNEGYQVKVADYSEDGVPVLNAGATYQQSPEHRWHAGHVIGSYHGPVLKMMVSDVDEEHRRKGLGMAMMEAVYAHAKTKGIQRVRGGKHSSLAHGLHQKMAEKHGLSYEANQNIDDYISHKRWREAPDKSFDDKFAPYSYTLKSEAKVVIPGRYRPHYTRNLDGWVELEQYVPAAMEQAGYAANLQKHLDATNRMLGAKPNHTFTLNKARLLLDDAEDVAAAALMAYDVYSPENLERLDLFLNDSELLKDEAHVPSIESYKIAPVRIEATETADAVQRAIDSGYINPVKLNGKHSKGSMLAKDPQSKTIYLLKPGSGKNSPAKGVSEDPSSQSEREAGFWHVADYIGIGDTFPRADLILVNNHQTAALELLPYNFHNLGEKKKQDAGLPIRILEPYRQNSTLFKWSLLDYVLGNPDRHSQNIMVDEDNKTVRLIDHGSALAGPSFDPSDDTNSFIPYYLRAWTDRKFTKMGPDDRLRYMPSLSARSEQIFDEWVADLNEHHIAQILQDYHINPSPAMQRIAKIRAMPGPKWMVLNKLWAGAI